jgi:hypothetical protein
MARNSRAVLPAGAGAAITVPAAALPTPGPAQSDAALIAASAAFLAWERARWEAWERTEALPPGPEKAAAETADTAAAPSQRGQYFAQLDLIAGLPAVTLDGMRAKARVIRQHWGLMPPEETEIAVSLVADLLAQDVVT